MTTEEGCRVAYLGAVGVVEHEEGGVDQEDSSTVAPPGIFTVGCCFSIGFR
jgi:hypothetical protein